MHIMKTKNLNNIFWSIIRQVRSGDKIRYDILDDKDYFFIELNRLSESKNSIYVIQEISNIKKEIEDGKHIKIEICNHASFTIHKVEEYYYIDNVELLLKCILFDMLHDVEYFKFVIKDNYCNILRNNKLILGVLLNFKSILFLDKKIPKEYYEMLEGILCEVKNNITEIESEYKNFSIEFSNGKEKFRFYIVL